MSDALVCSTAGDSDRAQKLLPPEEQLSVFEAVAFGRTEQLAAILREDPIEANIRSDDGTALHLAVFAEQPRAQRTIAV